MLQGSRNREKAKASNHGETKAREKEVYVAAEGPNIHAECNRCDFFGEEWYVLTSLETLLFTLTAIQARTPYRFSGKVTLVWKIL